MMGSLLDSYDGSLDRHSGDQETPSPLNISHSFEYLEEPEIVEVNNEVASDDEKVRSIVSVLSPLEGEESRNVSSSSSIVNHDDYTEDPN